jgi:pimeloyl-ACP methyl ester carboxylesterase
MPIAKLKHIKLYYEIHGKGEPLMMLTDLADDIQTWQFIISNLSKHFQLILFDNRGSGRSDTPNTEYSIEQFANDSIALLDFLNIPKTHLLGHGMGGFIAQEIAIQYPERVLKLVLECSAPYSTIRNNQLYNIFQDLIESKIDKALWCKTYYYWIYSHNFLMDFEFMDALIQFNLSYPYAQSKIGFIRQIEAVSKFDSRIRLPKITAETLVIIGEEDILVRAKDAEKLYQGITMASYPVFIENCAHTIHNEDPKTFVHTVLAFLYKYIR